MTYQPVNYYPNGSTPNGLPEDYFDPTQVPMVPGDTQQVVGNYQQQFSRQKLSQAIAQNMTQNVSSQRAIVPVTPQQEQSPIVIPIVLDITFVINRTEGNMK